MDVLVERLVAGSTEGAVYALIALSLVVVFRGTGTINFAQGEMALFTTFVAWSVIARDLPVWVALLVATASGFVLGALVERFLVRPVRKRNDMAVLIVLLGLFTVFNSLDGLIWGGETKVLASLLPNGPDDYVALGPARIYGDTAAVWIGTVLVLIALTVLFRCTRTGLHMRAVANDGEAAALAGVRVGRVLSLSWGLAGAIGSAAGVLVTPLAPAQLSLLTMLAIFLSAAAAALLGGLDSLVGAVVAGLSIGVLEALVIGYVPGVGSNLSETTVLVIIVLVLLVRPQGLFGTKKLERV
ncbi:branched-chain amino acid ABC transporter permease [Modestobacter sp. I12A-02628]|uniref:Branched-chain amino acid ABC transporter permease n=1 Tax=Goekera deserti TaxID=2497753 RepID=A0A7K3WIS5_9ACTN|nr:branched-chain amino acid ABC transporter permease [Goekera deserti]MPQ96498.1 branched-chain amino acid ABC transporter permease [Goekera deserti]NDI47187.1 branched-chain amino acid ABC transporter permease [Goekera deserti]NEL55413.1 branched-chain amino acid ABC transporter permease [Goekera deserti]